MLTKKNHYKTKKFMKSYSNDGGATWEGPLEDSDFELLREAGIITPYTMVREEGGPAPLPTESGSPPPPPEPEVTAQLYLSVRGEKRGPYSWEQIREMLRTGQVSDESPIWYEGLPNWVPLSTILHGDGDEPSGIFGGITGLSGVKGFSIGSILGGIFKHHTEKEMTDFFCCGSEKTTPNIREIDTRVPSPWIFARFLLWVVILYIGFYLTYDHWRNIRFFPSLLFVGSFGIPLCILILIAELNILRDISFYVMCKAVILGALISFVFTCILDPIIAQSADAYWAGPVEETAKLLAAIFVGRNLMNGRILTGVLIGTAVGVGFAALESAGYAFEEFAKYYALQCFAYMGENTSYVQEHAAQFSGYTPEQIINLIFEVSNQQASQHNIAEATELIRRRALNAFSGSHMLLTAITTGALWMAMGKRKLEGSSASFIDCLIDLRFLRIAVISIALHMFWNSDFLATSLLLKFFITLVITWGVALALISAGYKQIINEQKGIK